ncbi:PhnE/PtxC family ABC transporter permease [Brevibacillus nitrificans]|uniref:PhnE/PtxC family ABC transporter permease n=1 Tax=Brevibacillus nitrificans TaxID=651560 RepID=UPI00286782CA|nr:phosphonate transport system permease protein [Brevibacillus nitrificans]
MEMEESLKPLSMESREHKGALPTKAIKVKTVNRETIIIQLTMLVLVAATIYGFLTFDYKDVVIGEAILKSLESMKTVLLEPHLQHVGFGEAIYQVFVTMGLGFLTTLFGAVIALFLGLLAARNLSTQLASTLIRGVVAFIRAVPTVLWVLIFSVAAGLGSVAAVIGMTFHSVGYLIKAYSEAFEELDKGVIEALRASGANWWQIVFQAVLPSCATYLISWTFLRFEINFSVAVAMGAAAGAGGIGYDMFMASGFYYDMREVGAITYFILAIAILLEMFALRIKRNMKTH